MGGNGIAATGFTAVGAVGLPVLAQPAVQPMAKLMHQRSTSSRFVIKIRIAFVLGTQTKSHAKLCRVLGQYHLDVSRTVL
jgi:hypothetical protein